MITGQIQEHGYTEAIQSLTALPTAITAAVSSVLRESLVDTSSRGYLKKADAQSLSAVTARLRSRSAGVLPAGKRSVPAPWSFTRAIERVNSIEDLTRERAGSSLPPAALEKIRPLILTALETQTITR